MNIDLRLTEISRWADKDTGPMTRESLYALWSKGVCRFESTTECADIQALLQNPLRENELTQSDIRRSLILPASSDVNIPENCSDVSVEIAVTDSFSGAFFNHSVQDQLDEITRVCQAARLNDVAVRVYVHCAFLCPIDGLVSPQKVTGLLAKLLRAGCNEFFLVDNAGSATADDTLGLIRVMSNQISKSRSGFLFANRLPELSENLETALGSGITQFCCSTLADSPIPLSDQKYFAPELGLIHDLLNKQE